MPNCFLRICLIVLLSAEWALAGSSETAVHHITRDEVAQALAHAGIAIDSNSVSLAASVVASKANPEMDVSNLQLIRTGVGQTLWVRLACRRSGDCLPFYASLSWNDSVLKLPIESRFVPSNLGLNSGSASTVSSGERMIMVIPSSRSRIQLSVVTLQRGNIGQIIRVATPDHKQFYQAEIIDATLVRGMIQ